MKKIIAAGLGLLLLNLGGCSQNKPQEVKEEIKEEIKENTLSRVEFAENEEDLLQLLGISNDVWIYEYHAPEETSEIQVDFMKLEDGEWVEDSNLWIGTDESNGRLAFQKVENEIIKCNFQSEAGSIVSSSSNGLSEQYTTKAWAFLEESMVIEIGKPITIALLYYSNNGEVRAFGPEQYNNLELFENADCVRAIRLTFLEEK